MKAQILLDLDLKFCNLTLVDEISLYSALNKYEQRQRT